MWYLFLGLTLVWALSSCLWGYQFFRVQFAAAGCIGGMFLCIFFDNYIFYGSSYGMIRMVLIASLFAWIGWNTYKAGLFLSITVVTMLTMWMLETLFSLGISRTGFLSFGLAAALLSIHRSERWTRLYITVLGGFLAGCVIGIFLGRAEIGFFWGFIFAGAGVWYQSKHIDQKQPWDIARLYQRLEQLQKRSRTHVSDPQPFAEDHATNKNKTEQSGRTVLSRSNQRLWVQDTPLMITETAIFSDQERNGALLLGLALQNLSAEPIVAVYLDILCYDLLNHPLPSVKNAALLDFKLDAGACWYCADRIRLPNQATRKYVLAVHHIVFQNGQIWENVNNQPLLQIPNAEPLALPDALRAQYFKELNAYRPIRDAKHIYRFAPKRAARYWQCGCGQLNIEAQCICCKIRKDVLFVLSDGNWLSKQKEAQTRRKKAETAGDAYIERKKQQIMDSMACCAETGKKAVAAIFEKLQ